LGVSRAYAGYDAATTNSFSCSNWFRSNGSTGWYNSDYGGGIYQNDSSWVRVYNDKGFSTGGTIQSTGNVRAPIFYDTSTTSYYLDLDPGGINNKAIYVQGRIQTLGRLGTYDDAGLYLRGVDDGTHRIYYKSSTLINIWEVNTNTIEFQYYNGGSPNTRIYFDVINSRIGIGTSPSYALDVSGSARISNSLGVGTTPSGTAGEIRATDNITAYYSDERLKTKLGPIENPIEKVKSLSGFYFEANETAVALGYQKKREVGVSAQEVQAILPEIIAPAPISDEYMTVRYEKLIPLLIEAIKDQQKQIDELKALLASKS
jgi:hypothetical protein